MDEMAILAELIARHARQDGRHSTAIEGLTLVRSSHPTDPTPGIQQPMFCIVAQGRKQVALGNVSHTYDRSHYLIVSVALPVVTRIMVADPSTPYLCLRVALDPVILSEIVSTSGRLAGDAGSMPRPALQISEMSDDLIAVVTRLMRLLDKPEDIAALAPLAQRELYYRLLTGAQAGTVLQIAAAESKFQQVSRAIAWIREHYARPLSIPQLTFVSRMSKSALHKHFKAVTSMSPLQFQKHIRLQEARRLMIANGLDAASAGFGVGYSSATQFTREYRRMYGQPPARDAIRIRAQAGAATRASAAMVGQNV